MIYPTVVTNKRGMLKYLVWIVKIASIYINFRLVQSLFIFWIVSIFVVAQSIHIDTVDTET